MGPSRILKWPFRGQTSVDQFCAKMLHHFAHRCYTISHTDVTQINKTQMLHRWPCFGYWGWIGLTDHKNQTLWHLCNICVFYLCNICVKFFLMPAQIHQASLNALHNIGKNFQCPLSDIFSGRCFSKKSASSKVHTEIGMKLRLGKTGSEIEPLATLSQLMPACCGTDSPGRYSSPKSVLMLFLPAFFQLFFPVAWKSDRPRLVFGD